MAVAFLCSQLNGHVINFYIRENYLLCAFIFFCHYRVIAAYSLRNNTKSNDAIPIINSICMVRVFLSFMTAFFRPILVLS